MGNESHRTGRRAAGFAGAAILSAVLVSVLVRAGAPEPGSFVKPLTGEARALHALNRVGFGLRPGDVERIRAMGVEKLVEQQLHPERIAENPELAVRLEPLDTLGMSAGELVRRYPPPQVLRAVASGRLPYPSDRDERARYEALLRRLERMQAGARPAEDSDEGAGIEEPGPRPGREQRRGRAGGDPLAGILTQQERRRLRQGSPEERAKAMAALPREKQLAVIEALPPNRQMGLQFVAPPDLRRLLREYAPPQQVIQGDLVQGKLYRAILSERQLEEVLVDFWFNHFNVFAGKGADRFLVTSYEREAIRPHVLGKFENLLLATAQHPAMLFYLDNWQSVDRKAVEQLREMRSSGGARRRAGAMRSAREQLRGLPLNQLRGLNENYARELLELHTLGVDGGYTQKDVNEVARAFT